MLTRIARGLIRITRWHVYEVFPHAGTPEPEPAIAVTWRAGTATDIDSFTVSEHNYDPIRKQWARKALADGDRMLIAEADGAITHLAWTTHRQVTVAGVVLQLPRGTEYIYDARTPDPFRGKRLQNAEIRHLLKRADAEGIDRLLALVDDDVPTSIRNFEREGFVRIGTITTYRFLRYFTYVAIPSALRLKIESPHSNA